MYSKSIAGVLHKLAIHRKFYLDWNMTFSGTSMNGRVMRRAAALLQVRKGG